MDDKVKGFTSSDFRFFAGNGCVYAIALRPDANGEYTIKSLAKKQGMLNAYIEKIICLADDGEATFEHGAEALKIKHGLKGDMPVAFKIIFGG